jgi:RNA 3'-terminal phosphate cyclase
MAESRRRPVEPAPARREGICPRGGGEESVRIEMKNAESKMKNEENAARLSSFCILHFAFCIFPP